MKKIFFTTLVAVVALSGAFAQEYYRIGSNQIDFYCPTGISTCHIQYSEYPIVSGEPASEGQEIQFRLSTIPWDGVN